MVTLKHVFTQRIMMFVKYLDSYIMIKLLLLSHCLKALKQNLVKAATTFFYLERFWVTKCATASANKAKMGER